MHSYWPSTRRWRLAFLAILLSSSLVVGSTWSVFSHTWDEPEHLAAGLSLLDHYRYDYDIQHPPLGRVVMAVGPYLLGAHSEGKPPPDGRPEGVAILYEQGHYHEFLVAARAGMLIFLWLLFLATYQFAHRACRNEAEAVLAVGAVALTPVILGQAGLASLDVPAVATTLWAMVALSYWLEKGTRGSAVGMGVAGGLAVATKLSAIPFLGLAWPTLAVVHGVTGSPSIAARVGFKGRSRQIALSLLVALFVITLAYGGRFKYYTDASHKFNQALFYLFGRTGQWHDWAYAFAEKVPMPEAWQQLLGGIQALQVHNISGHQSYLLGQTRTSGWWYFYLVALAVKTPLPLLLLGVVGLLQSAYDGLRARLAWRVAPLALALVLLVFVSVFSHINIGVRHVLVLYPFLAMGAAYAAGSAWLFAHSGRAFATQWPRRLPWVATVGLLGWLLITSVRSYPDYLAYFNETVSDPEQVLVDSDLDWGQDLFRLEAALKARGVERLSFAYLGTADLARESLPAYTLLAPNEPTTGWVAVTALARMHARGGYDWLKAYPVVERVGKTIDLYHVPVGAPP